MEESLLQDVLAAQERAADLAVAVTRDETPEGRAMQEAYKRADAYRRKLEALYNNEVLVGSLAWQASQNNQGK